MQRRTTRESESFTAATLIKRIIRVYFYLFVKSHEIIKNILVTLRENPLVNYQSLFIQGRLTILLCALLQQHPTTRVTFATGRGPTTDLEGFHQSEHGFSQTHHIGLGGDFLKKSFWKAPKKPRSSIGFLLWVLWPHTNALLSARVRGVLFILREICFWPCSGAQFRPNYIHASIRI